MCVRIYTCVCVYVCVCARACVFVVVCYAYPYFFINFFLWLLKKVKITNNINDVTNT